MSILVTWDPSPAERAIMKRSWPSELPVLIRGELSDAELAKTLPEVQVMVGYMGSIPRDKLSLAPRLRLVHVLGHGVDALLAPDVVEQLVARGILVARSNPCAVPIAEFTIMSMIALSRRLVLMHQALTQRGDWSSDLWARRGEGILGGELQGSTLGIVGYGNIARELHSRVTGFGMRVGALTRHPDSLSDANLQFLYPWHHLNAFLAECDYVVLTLPLTAETRSLIGREQIGAMRRGAYLVNVSRGPIVDEDAVWEGLSSGQLGGVALDVFAMEEQAGRQGYPTRRPMHQFNALLTPHYSGATAEARERALTTVGDNLRALYADKPLRNVARLDEGF